MMNILTVLLVALVALPCLPESFRSILPKSLSSRIPRLDFTHSDAAGDSAKVHGPAATVSELSLDAVALEPGEAPKPAHHPAVSRSRRPARRVQPVPQDEAAEPEDVVYVPDHAVSMIPARFQTEIRLASASVREAADAALAAHSPDGDAVATRTNATHPDDVADKDWPLLCAQVVDKAGAPVEGARVELESPRLTVTTDAKGRFCLACPAGDCIVRIEADGRGRATRIIALKHSLFEMRIALAQ